MFIHLDDYNYLNINHIIKVSVEKNTLRILFSTGGEQIYFDSAHIKTILDKLKTVSL